jgi:hypothetical protein
MSANGQHKWLESIKDFDIGINYHPGKANVIAGALNHKNYCNATFFRTMIPELCHENRYLNLAIVMDAAMEVEVEPTLDTEIRKAQLEDEKLKEIR